MRNSFGALPVFVHKLSPFQKNASASSFPFGPETTIGSSQIENIVYAPTPNAASVRLPACEHVHGVVSVKRKLLTPSRVLWVTSQSFTDSPPLSVGYESKAVHESSRRELFPFTVYVLLEKKFYVNTTFYMYTNRYTRPYSLLDLSRYISILVVVPGTLHTAYSLKTHNRQQ